VVEEAGWQRFSVDIQGLLEALTEQFPEPLLCVRELIQNAADAGAQRIEVDASYDIARALFRLSVRDDARGMNEADIDGYLTIGFSEKDPSRQRGRFGVGKLSPYALGIMRMIVDTCDGQISHRLVFNSDGSGTVTKTPLRPRGTVVRIYKACARGEAEELTDRTFKIVEERCGSIGIPLFVNGHRVNREIGLPTAYAWSFSSSEGDGVLGICAEPIRTLMGGGIVLETGAPILGEEISYVLDSPRLSPTLSRNAVRRDAAFESLLRAAQAALHPFTEAVATQLRSRVARLRQQGLAAERDLDATDRAALEWLRSQLLTPDDDTPPPSVRAAPVLETADGGLVSAEELVQVIRREGRVPASRVPRTRDELSAYADRGVPVLLLYRDLEDFLERQAIPTMEVDGADDGLEIAPGEWSAGELALATRPPIRLKKPPRLALLGATAALSVALASAVMAERWLHEEPRQTKTVVVVVPPPEAAVGSELKDPPQAVTKASVAAVPRSGTPPMRAFLVTLAAVIALMSVSIGSAMLYFTLAKKENATAKWLRAQADAPITIGENGARKLDVLRRAIFHPIDFFVARGWSIRSSGARSLANVAAIHGYRELAPELPIRSGVRLDLDRIEIGFVDLLSAVGEPHDGRILLRRQHRVLLNRNHPTVRDLIRIAEKEPRRARVLLEAMLATDPDLAKGTDPRQVEWDLLGRAEHGLRAG
jgi:hypothetical protein